jgi:hypothetical protein
MPKTPGWPIDRLIPYAKNSRTHSEAQIAQLAASMKEWGWTSPVLADETGGVIAGHGRILAARLLGITEVPVMVARGWTDAEKRAYRIADNQLALNAGWNKELLGLELGELRNYVGVSPCRAGRAGWVLNQRRNISPTIALGRPPCCPISAVISAGSIEDFRAITLNVAHIATIWLSNSSNALAILFASSEPSCRAKLLAAELASLKIDIRQHPLTRNARTESGPIGPIPHIWTPRVISAIGLGESSRIRRSVEQACDAAGLP